MRCPSDFASAKQLIPAEDFADDRAFSQAHFKEKDEAQSLRQRRFNMVQT